MNCRGMTLLEVMVAMVLLAVAGLALLGTSGGQLQHLSRLEQQQLAYWLADNQLKRLQLQPQWPDERWHYGESEMAGQRWYWRWRGVSTSQPRLRALEIEVRRQKNARHVLATLHSWRSKPQ